MGVLMKHWIQGKEIDVNSHTLFRKKFEVEKLDANYRLHITADDYYKLYINSEFVGQGPAPSYHFAYNVNSYDVTKYLKEGENIIAVHCYYQGLTNYAWTSGDLRHGLYAELFCEGESVLVTDETWRWMNARHFLKDTKVVGYDTQFLENIDMRLYEHGWKLCDYNDSYWDYAVINKEDDHVAVMQLTPAVEVYALAPAEVKHIEKNKFMLDFGKEITTGLMADVCGREGGKIRLRFGEELDDEGNVRHNMRCNVDYEEFWTLSGKKETIENYDYKGFRYVEVLTDDPSVKPDDFKALVRHYPVLEKISISISDEKYKKIWDVCENAVIIGSQEGFLDCPTREKGQYLGNMAVTALSHTYITGDSRLYKKALTDFARSLDVCEGMSAVAPSGRVHNIADFSLMYPMQLLNYYNLTGDIEFLREMYSAVEQVMEYFKQYERSDGLLENVTGKWNLVDWPKNLRDDYDFDLTHPVPKGCHNVINAHYYGAMKFTNEIMLYLGLAPKYNLQKQKEAFMAEFLNEKTGLFTDTKTSQHSALHSNVLPLFYGMIEGHEAERILDWIEQRGFSCGVFFSYFVLKALTKHKRYQKAYDMIVSEGKQSWMNMIYEGATSCFEAWGKEQKPNTSLCHPWASAPVIVLIEDFAGIRCSAGKVKLNPQSIQGLSGKVSLTINGNRITVDF